MRGGFDEVPLVCAGGLSGEKGGVEGKPPNLSTGHQKKLKQF